jgi:hypothetical protein
MLAKDGAEGGVHACIGVFGTWVGLFCASDGVRDGRRGMCIVRMRAYVCFRFLINIFFWLRVNEMD